MLSAIINACKSAFHQIKEAVKQFTKPATAVAHADQLWQAWQTSPAWAEREPI